MFKVVLGLFVCLLSASSFADANKKIFDGQKSGYGDAGCGLGSLVFGSENKMPQQVVASTLNGTGMQSFAISSGTSNCMDSGAVKMSMQVPAFIEMNSMALAKDASRGQGETVASLASLMNCDSQSLGRALQMNYAPVFVDSKMQPASVEAGIYQAIHENSVACGS